MLREKYYMELKLKSSRKVYVIITRMFVFIHISVLNQALNFLTLVEMHETHGLYRNALVPEKLTLSILTWHNNEEKTCVVYRHDSIMKRYIYIYVYLVINFHSHCKQPFVH